MVLIKSNYFV